MSKVKASVCVLAAGLGLPLLLLGAEGYEARLRAGEEALRQGRAADAAIDLRVAAFGLLDKPPLLCEALAYQALAEEASGKTPNATLLRIAQISRALPSCREASMDPGRRAEFAALVQRRLGPQDADAVLGSPATAPAAPAVSSAAVAAAAPPPTARVTPIPAPLSPAAQPTSRPPAANPTAGPTPRPVEAPGSFDEPDRQPQIRATTKPAYPPAALQSGVGGIVLLRVLVSANGEPVRVDVARGVRSDLDSAAVTAVRQWRFEPAQKAGAPVEAWTTVAVPFDPSR